MDKKKVFITGSAGFVGKNLYRLLRLDYSVFGVDKIQNEFVDRVIDIRDVFYFVTFIFTFLFLSIMYLNKRGQ